MREVNSAEYIAKDRLRERKEFYLGELREWTEEMADALKKRQYLDPAARVLIPGVQESTVVTSSLFQSVLDKAQSDVKVQDTRAVWDAVKAYSVYTRALMEQKDVNHFHMNINRWVDRYTEDSGYKGGEAEAFNLILRKTLYAMDVISPSMFVYFDTYYQHGRDSKEVYSNDQTAQTAFIPDFPLWFTYYCAKLSSEIQSHPDSSLGHRSLYLRKTVGSSHQPQRHRKSLDKIPENLQE
jgi:hypothetical protein